MVSMVTNMILPVSVFLFYAPWPLLGPAQGFNYLTIIGLLVIIIAIGHTLTACKPQWQPVPGDDRDVHQRRGVPARHRRLLCLVEGRGTRSHLAFA